MLGLLRRLVPDFVRRRYALKFAIVLLLLGVVVAAVGVGATNQVETEVKEGAKDEYSQVARQESSELATWNMRNKRLAGHLSTTLAVRNGDRAEIDALLSDRTARPDIRRICYIDLNSVEVEVSTSRVEGQSVGELNVTDTGRLRSLAGQDGGQFYGAYALGSVQAMTYVAGTPDGEHAILVTMDADVVSTNLQGLTDAGAITVLTPDQEIVFDSKPDAQLGNYLDTYDAGETDAFDAARSESPGYANSFVAPSATDRTRQLLERRGFSFRAVPPEPGT
jgi:methyl-accepting chemotaxis protein